jgi:hypothetical protein
MTITEQLMNYWRAQGLPIAEGVSEGELRRFESEHGLSIPKDFREYFTSSNGMVQRGGADVDPQGFAFWPLEKVKPLPVVCAEFRVTVPKVENPKRYFVFADYLQWSWAYSIRLGTTENNVILVGAGDGDVVASSFTEFVSQYIADGEALYPKGKAL